MISNLGLSCRIASGWLYVLHYFARAPSDERLIEFEYSKYDLMVYCNGWDLIMGKYLFYVPLGIGAEMCASLAM